MALDFPSSPSSGQVFNPGGGALWQFDGTKWNSSAAGSATGALVYLGTLQANNSAQLDWTDLASYDAYLFQIVNIVPVVDGGAGTNYLQALFQVGGTWQTTSYNSILVGSVAPANATSETDAGGINLSGYGSNFNQTGNAAGMGVNGEVWLHAPNGTANYKSLTGTTRWKPHSGASTPMGTATVGGQYAGGSGVVTGIRFRMVGAGNNISAGQIRVYGLKTSSSPASPQIMQLGGQLKYVSATTVSFAPYAGSYIQINGVVQPIPPAGVVGLANTSVFVNGVAAQNLAASTVYYVYAFMNAGVLTADFSTTTHVTSPTLGNAGTEIKSGDDTRSLIGIIRTNASSQFVDSATQRFVLSWFNPAALVLTNNITANKSTTSATFVEWDATKRVEFLVWSSSVVSASLFGTSSFSNTAANAALGIGFDGIAGEPQQTGLQGALNVHISLSLNKVGLAEGYHYATPLFASGGGTCTIYGGTPSPTNPSVGSNVPSGINVLVR